MHVVVVVFIHEIWKQQQTNKQTQTHTEKWPTNDSIQMNNSMMMTKEKKMSSLLLLWLGNI